MPQLTPICAKCRVAMRRMQNDRPVRDPEAGGFPSTYWFGDEWECPGCGARIVIGFGRPLTEAEFRGTGAHAFGHKPPALEFRYEPMRSAHDDVELTDPGGVAFSGADMLRGLHLAVYALQGEEPGGAPPDAILDCIACCAQAAGVLLEARNILRRSKGLVPIDPAAVLQAEDGARP
jgi:hypothetical protein